MLRTCRPKSSRPGYLKLTSMSWIRGGTSSVGSGKLNFTCTTVGREVELDASSVDRAGLWSSSVTHDWTCPTTSQHPQQTMYFCKS